MKMKKILSVILSIGIVFSLGACGNGNNNENADSKTQAESKAENKEENKEETKKITKEEYEKMTADDLFKAIVKSEDEITLDEYVAIVETLQYVEITDNLDLKKNITEDVLKKIKNDYDFNHKPKPKDWVPLLVTHEAPQVRGEAFANAYPLYTSDPEFVSRVKELMKTETEPYVIFYIIYNLATSSRVASDPEIAAYLQEMTTHENARVQHIATSCLESAAKEGQ